MNRTLVRIEHTVNGGYVILETTTPNEGWRLQVGGSSLLLTTDQLLELTTALSMAIAASMPGKAMQGIGSVIDTRYKA